MENLVTITIRSTHYYLIDTPSGKLMVDTGWAGSLPTLKSQLNRYSITLAQIRYLMITHHHPDHAALTQEIKDACGAKLIIHEKQIPFLKDLEAFYREKGGFVPIRVEKDDLIVSQSNRDVLKSIGLIGEMVETPGHSDDSISLVLDGDLALTGDLTPPFMAGEDNADVIRASWERVLALKPKMIYPAHGSPVPAEQVRAMLGD